MNPGERIGILGRNGAGKSTLMKLISGALPPSGGERVASPDLIVGNFAQLEVDRLDSRDTALIALTNRIDEIGVRSQWDEQRRRNHLGGFGFRGDRVFEPVVHFSGGERARLALAILVAERPNLLLLDEPTNHLDFEMRHSLITALQDFAGAVIVVSHDRGLLRSVCDQFWLVADGEVRDFDGDLEDYSNWLEKRGSSASTPAAPKPRGEKATRAAPQGCGTRARISPRNVRRSSPSRHPWTSSGQERAKLEKELAGLDYARDAGARTQGDGTARSSHSRNRAIGDTMARALRAARIAEWLKSLTAHRSTRLRPLRRRGASGVWAGCLSMVSSRSGSRSRSGISSSRCPTA